jgi:two-component system, chemotaxis family, CheB/CheR fusion protein
MSVTLDDSQHSVEERPVKLLVVGIGASAGGITALKQFFTHVTPDRNVAYVVILHLSPSHDSRLAEVLQVTVPFPVTQVTDLVPIQPDHVYVIPPNKSLAIVDGALVLSEITRVEQRRAPVDVFFRALADAYGSHAACVILSGTGANGSAGLKRIKEHGGLAIAQDPNQAEYTDMPTNAIATGLIDVVLPVEDIPKKINEYHLRLPTVDEHSGAPAADTDDVSALRDILTLLKVRTGHDFSNYKQNTLLRRIHRRMTVVGLPTVGSYAQWVREEANEPPTLLKELLISVTHFFRDAEAFTLLEERLIPRLFTARTAQDQVRIWVPGCATGEEAYSIAMLLCEYLDGSIDQPSVQIFATDLDEEAVAIAREGFYGDAGIVDLSEARLERFFQRQTSGYRIRRELRELVLFAHHNIVKDPPFSHLDLISCRNLLIYLNRSAQDRVIETFHFALRPGGYLLLGPSESPDGSNDLFITVDRTSRVYQSRAVSSRLALLESPRTGVLRSQPRAAESRPAERFAPLDVHHRLLEEYAPPSLIVSEDHTIVHMSPSVGRYLLMVAGEPSRDLMKLVRPELRADLRTALYQSAKQRTSIEVPNVPVVLDGAETRLSLVVRPVLRDEDPGRGFFLVQFADQDRSNEPHRAVRRIDAPAEPVVQQLEEELSRIKAQLRTTIEQYEAQVEEAHASAEEQQATTEELRSAAEELETGKEELQSVNEELMTVNQELKTKIEELRLSNSDFQNLINSTDIATIFLDRSLRLKLTTPRAREVFNVLRSDMGRPLADITSRLHYDQLEADMKQVLDALHPIDREVQSVDGRWYQMRIRPYRTVDDRIDGIVVMFPDITDRRSAESTVARSDERLRLLIDSASDYAIFTMSDTGEIDSWNSGAERLFGYRAEQIIGRNVDVLFTPEERALGLAAAELQKVQRDGRSVDERYHVRRDGTLFYASGVTTRLGRGPGLGFAKIARDLTGHQHAAQALRDAHTELETRVAERTRELGAEVKSHEAAQLHIVNLLRKVVTAQEDERGRIARNLHDQLGQRLTALRLFLERAQQQSSQSAEDGDLARALALVQTIDTEVGFLAWELRPAVLDHLGLSVALPRYVREWSEHYGVEAKYSGETFQEGVMSREAEIALYRIAQEALTNSAKHAHASRVDVLLELRDGSLTLIIEDDGVGFDPDENRERGIGLLGMRERAGLIGADFQLESALGEGTSIYVRHTPGQEQHSGQP